jgi:hypothetical protein
MEVPSPGKVKHVHLYGLVLRRNHKAGEKHVKLLTLHTNLGAYKVPVLSRLGLYFCLNLFLLTVKTANREKNFSQK